MISSTLVGSCESSANLVNQLQIIECEVAAATGVHPREAHQLLAARLATSWRSDRAVAVTWLNHFSAQTALLKYEAAVAKMDYVGVDGILLKRLVGEQHRTSADLVIPDLLPRISGARVLLIGGTAESIAGASSALGERFPDVLVVGVADGFNGLPRGAALMDLLARTRPDVVLIGLGAGLQEEVADEVRSYLSRGLVLTCGGFLDQIQQNAYYPAWAYPLRLNWAVRLAREPRRLWRRYTVDALGAYRTRRHLCSAVNSLHGYASMQSIFMNGTQLTSVSYPEALIP